VYNVEANKSYRFRFINSGFNVCPFLLQIEHHNMTIIATEISYVEPFSIDSLFSSTGERFDFVIHTNNTPGDYWVRAKTMSPCRLITEGFAILRYGNKSGGEVAFAPNDPPRDSQDMPMKRLFNSPKPKVLDIPFLALNATEYDESIINGDPDFKFQLFLDSPTISDDILYTNGTDYRMNCEQIKILIYFTSNLN
jgi:FtsP/CotA-like multicopper oxidase with cupredoxin domain